MDASPAVAIPTPAIAPALFEKIVVGGDLSQLNAAQRTEYYAAVCRSLGLNPLTRPFEYLTLNGKLRLYALRDCADQLRRLYGISVYITNRERLSDIYIVTARAKARDGREDESTGAVTIGTLKGDALANALMKAETKAKRRVTLSICGLGMLDESELDTTPQEAFPTRPAASATGHTPPVVSGSSAEGHPTAEQINDLFDLAQVSCHEPKEVFGRRLREIMGLTGEVRVSKKFLRDSMTLTQFEVARTYYKRLLKQQVEEDVPDGLPPSTGEPNPHPEGEKPRPDDEVAKAALRQEAIGWGIREDEVAHVIAHHTLEKARNLLYTYRE
jgi:hypothetical protein